MFAISHINPVQLFLLSVRELLKLENSLTFSMVLCRKRKEEKKKKEEEDMLTVLDISGIWTF